MKHTYNKIKSDDKTILVRLGSDLDGTIIVDAEDTNTGKYKEYFFTSDEVKEAGIMFHTLVREFFSRKVPV